MTAPLAKVARWLLAAGCGALAACSSFDAQWRAAEQSGTPTAGTRWEGRWTSERHTGPGGRAEGGRLRAVLRPGPAAALDAAFRAHWKIFSSDYALVLTPTGVPGHFRGTHELPAIFGGTYHYTAGLAGDDFTARYHSSYDAGTFTMRRLPLAKDSPPRNSRH